MLTGLNFSSSAWKMRDIGLLQEIENAHFFGIERVLESARDIGDLRQIDREQENMRDIDLPGALEDARAGDDKAAIAHRAAIDEGGGVAGNEDEDLGGVAEAVIADRHPADDVGRDMVEKDQPEREPAEKIEPQIAIRVGTAGGIDALRDRIRRPAFAECLTVAA